MPHKSVVRGSALLSIVDGLEADKTKRIAFKQGDMAEFCGSIAEIYEIDGDKVYAKIGPRTGWFDKAEIDAMELEWKVQDENSWMQQFKKEVGVIAYKLREAPGRGVVDESKWEKAKTEAEKTYDRSDGDKFWAVTSTIYKNMGGEYKKHDRQASYTKIVQEIANRVKREISPNDKEKFLDGVVKMLEENVGIHLTEEQKVRISEIINTEQKREAQVNTLEVETEGAFKDYFLLNVVVKNPEMANQIQASLYDYLQKNENIEMIFADQGRFTFKSKTMDELKKLVPVIREITGEEAKLQIREAQKKS